MDDHELIARLHRAADTAGEPSGDLAEVELGAARVRGRRRWATGVVAAMLVAGAGGAGFGLGRAAGDSDRATSADGDLVEAPSPAPAATDAPTDTIPAPDPEPATTAPTVTMAPAIGTVTIEGDDMATATDYAVDPAHPGAGSYTLVYERPLPNDLRVRVLEGVTYDMGPFEVDWSPAAWCYPNVETRITIDGTDVVDVSGASIYADASVRPTAVWAQRADVGMADGHPIRLLIAQAPAAANVTVRWADGPTDTTDVVDGLAVLAVDGSDSWNVEYELDVVTADGTTTLTSAESFSIATKSLARGGTTRRMACGSTT